jgi:hypothetical protein
MSNLNQNIISVNSGTTTTSGATLNNYIFIDNSGNVTQINKSQKERSKYYIDPDTSYGHCVIGIDGGEGSCIEGTALGLSNNSMSEVIYTSSNKARGEL